jgi:CBS domain-containing protein
MTKDPACVVPGDTVVRAAQLMKGEDVGPVLVVKDKKDKELAGIVTDRDVAIKVVAEGKDPNSVRVKDVMTSRPVTCKPEDDLSRALEMMKSKQVRRIPIVDDSDRVVGIIAQADIARKLSGSETGNVVSDVSSKRGFFGGSRRKSQDSNERWSAATRMAIAAAGGGLMFYGLRSTGRTRKIAATAGAALMARGLTGRPFEGLGDLMNPSRAFGL